MNACRFFLSAKVLFVYWFVTLLTVCPGKEARADQAGAGFLFAIEAKTPDEIRQLSDEELTSAYIELLIELEASTTFSRTAGFNPRDYAKYKRLLRYRADLFQEISRRDLPVPRTGASCPEEGRERLRK